MSWFSCHIYKKVDYQRNLLRKNSIVYAPVEAFLIRNNTTYMFNNPLIKDRDVQVDDYHKSPTGNVDDDREHMAIKYSNDNVVTHVYEDYSYRMFDKDTHKEIKEDEIKG